MENEKELDKEVVLKEIHDKLDGLVSKSQLEKELNILKANMEAQEVQKQMSANKAAAFCALIQKDYSKRDLTKGATNVIALATSAVGSAIVDQFVTAYIYDYGQFRGWSQYTPNVQGASLTVVSRTGASNFAFGIAAHDDGTTAYAPLSLTLTEGSGVEVVSESLLWACPADVTADLSKNLAEQAGSAEDVVAITAIENSTAAHQNVTGVLALSDIISAVGQFNPEAQVASDSAIYMNWSTYATIRATRAGGSTTNDGMFLMDIQSAQIRLMGMPIKFSSKIDSTGTDKFPVYVGSMKNALRTATGIGARFSWLNEKYSEYNAVGLKLFYTFGALVQKPSSIVLVHQVTS